MLYSLESIIHPISLPSFQIENNLFLAPMAGFTHKPFRELVKSFGAGLTFTEMVSVEGILRDNKKTFRYVEPDENGGFSVQLFGSPEPQKFYKAALFLKRIFDIKMVDINFGCPVRKVLKGKAGAYLLNFPEKMADIVKAVKDADLIVSAKIRSGFNSVNIEKTIPALDDAGADIIIFHSRLATQFYGGRANWELFAIARDLTNKILIANGDIKSLDDVRYIITNYRVDGVMIGRKALEAPYIFEIIRHYFESGELKRFSRMEIMEIIKKFVSCYCNYYKKDSIKEIRGLLMHLVKNLASARELRKKIAEIETISELMALIEKYKVGKYYD
ncbi:MAG: tRNA dihydrouridine synthase [Brevinematia bacterium]